MNSKTLSENRRARFDYEIKETIEAGIELRGFEAKSAKLGRMGIVGSHIIIKGNEAWLLNMHIANTDETERSRKLLLHKAQIQSLIGKTQQKGLSLIPLALYIKKGKAKLEIAFARGKKIYDHRETLKKRDINRQVERELKE